jgi:hypothetical protein
MVAEIKSHVLRRDEKGFLGIPFKRWLLSGVIGGMVFAVGSIALSGGGIALGFGVALGVLILTGERYGMPRWLRWWLAWRGLLILRAVAHPQGLAARLTDWLDIPVQAVMVVEGDQLFAPPSDTTLVEPSEWISLLDPHAENDDLIFIDQP